MYIETPFNFTGSKFKILEQILPLFDYNKSIMVDLFAGGGSVYSNVLDKYDKILVNDIIKDLILIQKKLILTDGVIDKVKKICVDKDDNEGYLELRKDYNNDPTPEKLWALMLCCTNNMLRFNQKFEFNQTFGKRTFNRNTEKKVNNFIEYVRPYKNKLMFTHKRFSDIPVVMKSFYYIDPPYGYIMKDDGTMGNKQISEAGYNAYYKKEDDVSLYNYVHKINDVGATFLMSGVLEHDGQKSWILHKLIEDGFSYKDIHLDYGKVSRKKNDKGTKEIVVFNYRKEENIDEFSIECQDGELVKFGRFFRDGNSIVINNKVIGQYNNKETTMLVLKQLASSINGGIKVYKMPPKDVDMSKKWYDA
jgi:adenine-specific DNA-methyltransferase